MRVKGPSSNIGADRPGLQRLVIRTGLMFALINGFTLAYNRQVVLLDGKI